MVYPVLTPRFTLFQSYHNSYQLMQDVFIFLHPQYDCAGLWSVRGYSLVSRLCEAFLIQSRVSLTKWSAFPLILPKAWVSLLKCLQADLCVADLSIVLLSLQESLQAVQRSILPLSGEIKRADVLQKQNATEQALRTVLRGRQKSRGWKQWSLH